VKKEKKILVEIEIDKLTNSIENVVSGDIFDTEVIQLFNNDTKQINKTDWQFNWQGQLKLAFAKDYDGYLAFDAKTILVKHYQETLYATHFRGTKMMIETPAANRLIKQYFKS